MEKARSHSLCEWRNGCKKGVAIMFQKFYERKQNRIGGGRHGNEASYVKGKSVVFHVVWS